MVREETKRNYRPIMIPRDAFNSLGEAKQKAIELARQKDDKDLVKALTAMGIGAFAGWIIYKFLEEVKQQ
jgi:hypothetical protein